jgi:hypothetical protein
VISGAFDRWRKAYYARQDALLWHWYGRFIKKLEIDLEKTRKYNLMPPETPPTTSGSYIALAYMSCKHLNQSTSGTAARVAAQS